MSTSRSALLSAYFSIMSFYVASPLARPKTKKRYRFALFSLLLTFSVSGSALTQINIVAEEFPPLQSQGEPQKSGYVHLLMQEAIRRVNLKHPVQVTNYDFLPWKRALLKAQMTPNTLFYSLSRTPQRESKYQWLGEVSRYSQSLFTLASKSDIEVTSLQQFKGSSTVISVQNGSALQDLLEAQGLIKGQDFQTYIHYRQGIKQLFKGRIDLIPLNDLTARQSTCKLGLNGAELLPTFTIETLSKPLWAVFSNSTSLELVSAFRQAISDIKKEGLFDRYYEDTMQVWNNLPCNAHAKSVEISSAKKVTRDELN